MSGTVLSSSQIDEFIERGHVVLRQAFPRAVAARVRAALWPRLGLHPRRPGTWRAPLVHLHENFSGQPFMSAVTPRLRAAFGQLMGRGQWRPLRGLGWWPVSFPGFARAGDGAVDQDWHVDGGHFHHRLTTPDQGLLPIFLFSDIGSDDGGTLLADGSHRHIARVLAAAEPAGLDMAALGAEAEACAKPSVSKACGEAGDVVLIHPFLVHARGRNRGKTVRFICNPCVSLRRALDLESARPTPVEQAIIAALDDGRRRTA